MLFVISKIRLGMKKLTIVILASLLTCVGYSQTINPKYDSALAAKLGADDYGMKTYVFVMLKTGSNELTDKVVREVVLLVT